MEGFGGFNALQSCSAKPVPPSAHLAGKGPLPTAPRGLDLKRSLIAPPQAAGAQRGLLLPQGSLPFYAQGGEEGGLCSSPLPVLSLKHTRGPLTTRGSLSQLHLLTELLSG